MNKTRLTIPCAGYAVAAHWYENETSNDILLVLTGYGSTKDRYAEFIEEIAPKTGASALVIDYSGHGESPFELDETRPAQHFLEVICAFDWLRTNYPEAAISVIGASYGGFHAAQLSRYRDFKKLVLREPAIYRPADFYSLQPQIDREYTSNIFRKDTLAVASHPLFAQPAVFTGPTLLVVHGNDEDVPKETTDVYAKAFNADMYVAEGFKHSMRDPENPPEGFAPYYNAIIDWLNR